MDGDVRFRPLSYYHQIEDGAVRGDGNEGSIYTQPDTGLPRCAIRRRATLL